jgi:hypothetical protein
LIGWSIGTWLLALAWLLGWDDVLATYWSCTLSWEPLELAWFVSSCIFELESTCT